MVQIPASVLLLKNCLTAKCPYDQHTNNDKSREVVVWEIGSGATRQRGPVAKQGTSLWQQQNGVRKGVLRQHREVRIASRYQIEHAAIKVVINETETLADGKRIVDRHCCPVRQIWLPWKNNPPNIDALPGGASHQTQLEGVRHEPRRVVDYFLGHSKWHSEVAVLKAYDNRRVNVTNVYLDVTVRFQFPYRNAIWPTERGLTVIERGR